MTAEAPTFIDRFAKLLGMVASLCLAASVVYDWGYYYALDLSFSDVPTSLADHTRTAVNWIPKSIFFLCFGALIGLDLRRLDEAKAKQGTENPKAPSKAGSRRWSPARFSGYLAIALVSLTVLFGERFLPGAAWTIVFLWPSIAARTMGVPQIVERLPSWAPQAVTVVPIVFIYAWISGYGNAVSAISRAPSTEIKVTGQPVQKVTVLRYLERGVVFKSSDGSLLFRQWATLESVQRPLHTYSWRGALCEWFSLSCSLYPA